MVLLPAGSGIPPARLPASRMMAAMVVALELASLGVLLHSVAPALPDRLPESLALVLCFLGSFVLHHRCAAARLLGKAGCVLERL